MTWGLTATTRAPGLRGAGLDRGGYSYSSPGWSSGGSQWSSDSSSWKGGSDHKGDDHQVALGALTLLSFLFFLNMLQQQMLVNSSGQQTFLFMVNGTNTAGVGRRRREVENFQQQPAVQFLTDSVLDPPDATSAMPEVVPPLSPPTTDEEERAWTMVTARVQSLQTLPPEVASLLPSCGAVLACALQRAAGPGGLESRFITEVLRELRPADGLDEACAALLADERGRCGPLVRSFSAVLPSLGWTPPKPVQLKHDLF